MLLMLTTIYLLLIPPLLPSPMPCLLLKISTLLFLPSSAPALPLLCPCSAPALFLMRGTFAADNCKCSQLCAIPAAQYPVTTLTAAAPLMKHALL